MHPRDGIVRVPEPARPRRLAAAVGVLVVLAGVVLWLALPRREGARPPAVPRATSAPVRAPGTPPPPRRAAAAAVTPPAALGEADDPGPGGDDEEQEIFVDQLDRGDGTGIHAFPLPGTKKIRHGIIVPDGFELPPGYVRHHQTTDEGEEVPPILMFHPDHTPRDAAGRPVPMPEGRIVPPELAPPGMLIEHLEPTPVRKDLPP
jgi:hypothetical protein